ncbi:circadian clock protein KaiA [Chamaesiphon minutus]|uniref:Circadian clock oscillator protein KaiA n=1 Tax=Chamaesiphon minutus (strain ATCC 27169 / PCC 6605) TaxID=1173020 RepID=K9UA02_CHAP6|nr:circadian clock protein KaiA [Chamaesiphon minutus]AFY91927.1 KaiA domain protein [Chamaesiphon minutus PCC 6605]
MSGSLTIAVLADSADLFALLGQNLSVERYAVKYFTDRAEFLDYVERVKYELDCLVFYSEHQLLPAIEALYVRGLILPVVIVHRLSPDNLPSHEPLAVANSSASSSYIYQPSEVTLAVTQMSEMGIAIDKAIAKFLNLTPIPSATRQERPAKVETQQHIPEPNFLRQQQSRLSQKLTERLGYLAVYYRRNPSQFFRHLDRRQKQELLDALKLQYRHIVLEYFADSTQIDLQIDEFVSAVFFRDLAVSEIVKIHMELMEEFSDQLKLEGRSEEILLDYRLTLIDIIAHLCEMYRRSIPREM